MPAPRYTVVVEGEERTYHCICYCVRHAYLCGKDPLTGKSYNQRKEWIRDRLMFLAENFAVDVVGYAIMPDHLHLIVRVRPDIVERWQRQEVALRWLKVFPRRIAPDAEKPLAERAAAWAESAQQVAAMRQRLSSISWFVRCLNEAIARMANREDGTRGRFWEGRFQCQVLLDEMAILACLAHVDLNPLLAKEKISPAIALTSLQDRAAASRRCAAKAMASGKEKVRDDAWLCPIENQPGAPRRGILPLTRAEYLEVVDYTAKALRSGKRGALPDHLRAVLARVAIDAEKWLEMLKGYERWFARAAGSVEKLAELAKAHGKKWLKGIPASRRVFVAADAESAS